MHPNLAALILAGATPVDIYPTQKRKPHRIGARSANERTVLGRRAIREGDSSQLLSDWAIWDVSMSSYMPAYMPTQWEHPDAQWDQIPENLLLEFVEGS